MAIAYNSSREILVAESTTTTGTGTVTLAGALNGGMKTFSSAVPNGTLCAYYIYGLTAGVYNGEYEDGFGVFTLSGTTLSRLSVNASSNSGSLVNFSSGTKYVYLTKFPFQGTQIDACNGRLTTETGVPVSTSDRTGQGTLYFTPYNGNKISLYNGTYWVCCTFAELSLSLTLTSGKNYDVFVYSNSGVLTLELSAAWTNDTTRADAITLQDGIYCKSGSLTRRWVGTIRASGSNVTADSGGNAGTTQTGAQRFVWNRYNQVRRNMKVIDTTSNYTYQTNTIRQTNNASGNKIEYVIGDSSIIVDATVMSNYYNSGAATVTAKTGVGVDSTTTFSGILTSFYNGFGGGYIVAGLSGTYSGAPGLGYHYLSWNESGANGGDGGFYLNVGGVQAGMTGMILG